MNSIINSFDSAYRRSDLQDELTARNASRCEGVAMVKSFAEALNNETLHAGTRRWALEEIARHWSLRREATESILVSLESNETVNKILLAFREKRNIWINDYRRCGVNVGDNPGNKFGD